MISLFTWLLILIIFYIINVSLFPHIDIARNHKYKFIDDI